MSNFIPETKTFGKFDPLFTNKYDKVGPEFGQIQQLKSDFLAANVGKLEVQPEIPQNIEGLVLRSARTQRTPATMAWFRRTTSFERNGIFNIHTPVMNTRILPWVFFIFIAYGWQGYQISSWNTVVKKDSNEPRNTPYDKLSLRELPPAKNWARPG
ncbi:unnamed protein product (macronuclear) [Paramecium tetraurelia]|uniref:Uncharacterized protein n=1 Tax=Paramecium tetraurelia TaxID=5888 RepID=A0DMF7_PARTE|nr:uncharacterized protein GSPATT00018442001 [Paramecium tetraurelia]CAK84224.1 unnamed protein product [Paramecium tetraurelia]|eukprot:XP_001451621.1 hypothetical protein (macronuclear) [Paramecium tetraurelia strain d4-2]